MRTRCQYRSGCGCACRSRKCPGRVSTTMSIKRPVVLRPDRKPLSDHVDEARTVFCLDTGIGADPKPSARYGSGPRSVSSLTVASLYPAFDLTVQGLGLSLVRQQAEMPVLQPCRGIDLKSPESPAPFEAVKTAARIVKSEKDGAFVALRDVVEGCVLVVLPAEDTINGVRILELTPSDSISVRGGPLDLADRIRTALRRSRRVTPLLMRSFHFGNLTIDANTQSATRDGQRIPLTAYELAILSALAEHAGEVLSRERLLELSHNSADDAFDRSIDVQISRIRAKLGDDPRRPGLLRTVRGAGYVLVPPVGSGSRSDTPDSGRLATNPSGS